MQLLGFLDCSQGFFIFLQGKEKNELMKTMVTNRFPDMSLTQTLRD